MKFCLAALFLALSVSAMATAQDGRVVIIAKDIKTLQDGRITVTMPSGTQVTLGPADVDLRMMQLLAKEAPAPTSDDGQIKVDYIPTSDAAMTTIRPKCAKDWPTDYQMQEHCQTQQRDAVLKLWTRNEMLNDRPFRVIRNKCQTEWPSDFQMQDYCEDQQLKSLAAIKGGQ